MNKKPKTTNVKQVIETFVKSDYGIALIITLAWQLAMTVFGFLIDSSASGLLGHINHWDTGWYLHVSDTFYSRTSNPASPVFYPLFPVLVNTIQTLFMGKISLLTTGVIVNTASIWLALAAIIKISRLIFGNIKSSWLVVALVLTSPAAFFMHMFYGEAVFLALASWAYLFSLQKNWLPMGILLAAATSARLPAVLFIGLCGLEYLRSYSWSVKAALNKNILAFALAPIGFIAYGTYLYIVRGDFFAMFSAYHATSDWAYHVFNVNFLQTIASSVQTIIISLTSHHFTSIVLVNEVLPLAGLVILFTTSVYGIFVMKDRGIPLGIFGLLSLVMFTLNSNIISVHRYLLPCLSIYLLSIHASTKYTLLKPVIYVAMFTGLLLQAYLIARFTSNNFAG